MEHVYHITAAIAIIIRADDLTKDIIIGTPICICKFEYLMQQKPQLELLNHGKDY